MANSFSKGICFLCGKTLTKTGAKRHLLTHEYDGENSRDYRVIKVEAPYDKNYWLYVDMSLTSTLRSLDGFLREIWLECCGHLSAFFAGRYEEISKNTKISSIPEGSVLSYEYDFGSTTELKISFVGTVTGKQRKEAVRLLVRNEAPSFYCSVCGKPATYICCECIYESDNPFFCDKCSETHQETMHELFLPVVNSPRMGVCGYDGELDTYEFDVGKIEAE